MTTYFSYIVTTAKHIDSHEVTFWSASVMDNNEALPLAAQHLRDLGERSILFTEFPAEVYRHGSYHEEMGYRKYQLRVEGDREAPARLVSALLWAMEEPKDV